MYRDIQILDANGWHHCFTLRFEFSNYKRIDVENVCVIDIYKYHNHRYDIKAFFYKTKYVFYRECISTKKELYDVIQNLLKENL